jgi:hypothetical protein
MMTAMYGHPACARLLLDKGHPIDGEVRGGRFDGEGALNFALKAHVAAHLTPASREGARDVAMQLLDRSRASDPAGFSVRHVSDLFQCMCVGTGTLHTDDDPLPALKAAVADGDVAEVAVVTYPHAVEDTFHRDWASRARDELQVPVLHLYALAHLELDQRREALEEGILRRERLHALRRERRQPRRRQVQR